MPYSAEQQKKLKSLLESVEQRKAHQYAAPTFLDSPALAKIRSIAEEKLSGTADKETLEDSVEILRYLAGSYESMNRVAYAVNIYKVLLQTEISVINEFSADKYSLRNDFYSAVRANNYYSKYDCAELVLPLLGAESVKKIISEITENYPRLKRDPVELTDRYLSVIDKVEEKIENEKKTDLCHEFWSLKKQYLYDLGIVWHSPAELNPGVLFD